MGQSLAVAMVALPPRGSSLTVVEYICDGEILPTIGWLRQTGLHHGDAYWMVEFVRPAKLTDICTQSDPWQPAWAAQKQPNETHFPMHERQQQQQQQPEKKRLTKVEQQKTPQQQQEQQASAHNGGKRWQRVPCMVHQSAFRASHWQDEQPSPATKQMLPATSPPPKTQRPSAQPAPCPKPPSPAPPKPCPLPCPQPQQSHHQQHSSTWWTDQEWNAWRAGTWKPSSPPSDDVSATGWSQIQEQEECSSSVS